ncbi:MAG: hypothetical protein ACLUJU_06145 [Subdoligranulum sp.]
MMFLSRAESSYLHQHLSVVRHVTLDPEGPGVLRIHLLPCKKARRNVPFVALLNGQDILPLSVSWAILLAGLMDALQPFEGKEITEDQWWHCRPGCGNRRCCLRKRLPTRSARI